MSKTRNPRLKLTRTLQRYLTDYTTAAKRTAYPNLDDRENTAALLNQLAAAERRLCIYLLKIEKRAYRQADDKGS